MADAAVRLMPFALGRALTSYRADLLRGMLAPLAEDGPARRAPWAGGTLDEALEADAQGLVQVLRSPAPFSAVAGRFGSLAHQVLESGFPPGVSRQDGATRYAHFAAFCESRRERFPVVFYGHRDEDLDDSNYRAFALAIMDRASQDDRELARAYAAAGNPPDPDAFDDRSVPFAVASLAYSRSINDIVRVWLQIWNRAGGDMNRTPYFKPNESTTNQRRP